jgi:hypothetical protein
MKGRLGILAAVAALALGVAPAGVQASAKDIASTHAYAVAAYAALHEVVTKWSTVEAAVHKLDLKFRAECPKVGAGSPQSEEEQLLSTEVAGALWATGYRSEAKVVRKFVQVVGSLTWSNPAITRAARRFTKGLHEMTLLPIPDLCGDVRAWTASGYKTMPSNVAQYDRRVEAIEVKEIPRKLLLPYAQPSDRGLIAADERLDTRFGELEFERGQDDWDKLLEVLALNQ